MENELHHSKDPMIVLLKHLAMRHEDKHINSNEQVRAWMDRQQHIQQVMINGHPKTNMDLPRTSSKHSIRILQIPDLVKFH